MRLFRLRNLIATTALGAAVSLTAAGCADNNSSIFIVGVAQPSEASEDGCAYDPDGNTTLYISGVFDVSFGGDYGAVLLVGNQLVERGSRDQIRTETSWFVVKGAEVDVQTVTGTSLNNFSVTAHATVPPGTGEDPGFGVVGVTLIPTGTTGLPVNSQVNAHVRLFGETLGNEELESSEMVFPISICNNCLRYNPAPGEDCPDQTFCQGAGQDIGVCIPN